MGRQKKKKKKGTMTTTATTKGYTKWYSPHIHGKFVEIGGYRVWMRSSGGILHPTLDIYIDLAAMSLQRVIPPQLCDILPPPKPLRIVWEMDDGHVDADIPNHVITLLKAGYKVGWGCLGGHGRTGWLAAKVHMMLTGCTGREAVDYVKKNYCEDAVETLVQLRDLGAIAADPVKEFTAEVFSEKTTDPEDDKDYWDRAGFNYSSGSYVSGSLNGGAREGACESDANRYLQEWEYKYGKIQVKK